MSEKPVRILIADDHQLVREGLRLIIETEDGLTVAGEAADGKEAVDQYFRLLPDVVLMDLRMPRMSGLEAIAEIISRDNSAAVIILTTYNEDDLMLQGMNLGARGFLLKDTDSGSLFNAVRAAAGGDTLVKPEVMKRLLAAGGRRNRSGRSGSPALTERELEVLKAAAGGLRSKEIAWEAGITERTVKAHLSSIYNKLGVDSRAAAVAEAVRLGLI